MVQSDKFLETFSGIQGFAHIFKEELGDATAKMESLQVEEDTKAILFENADQSRQFRFEKTVGLNNTFLFVGKTLEENGEYFGYYLRFRDQQLVYGEYYSIDQKGVFENKHRIYADRDQLKLYDDCSIKFGSTFLGIPVTFLSLGHLESIGITADESIAIDSPGVVDETTRIEAVAKQLQKARSQEISKKKN